MTNILNNNLVNGRYTEWSRWGDCSATCGGGELTKTRTCTDPAPANGGKDCVGVASLSQACNKHACQGISQILLLKNLNIGLRPLITFD